MFVVAATIEQVLNGYVQSGCHVNKLQFHDLLFRFRSHLTDWISSSKMSPKYLYCRFMHYVNSVDCSLANLLFYD
jgi:hypothetical protein